MTVYVDNARIAYRNMCMSHMVADTHDELVRMADAIGVARKWIQKAGASEEHFDICQSKRKLAVAAGAVEVDGRELVRVIRAKRVR